METEFPMVLFQARWHVREYVMILWTIKNTEFFKWLLRSKCHSRSKQILGFGSAVSKSVIREADSAQGRVYNYIIPFHNCAKQLAAYISANDWLFVCFWHTVKWACCLLINSQRTQEVKGKRQCCVAIHDHLSYFLKEGGAPRWGDES